MILTTTPNIEGKRILEYKGVVFGEVVSGVVFYKDFFAGFRDFFGGRTKSYEGELIKARNDAITEMTRRAMQMGANAVIGMHMDCETISRGPNIMLVVVVSGTAVNAQ